MYQASSQQHRKVVAAAARSVKPPKSMRKLDWPHFLQAYYANVDAADLAARESHASDFVQRARVLRCIAATSF